MSIFTAIDGFSRSVGRLVSWIMLGLTLLAVCDILLRRFASSPIPWAFDVSVQLFAVHFMLATPFALLAGEHVRVTLFRDRLSNRSQAVLEIVCYAIFFLPMCLVLIVYGADFAQRAWQYGERSPGVVAVPVYYVKTIIPVTGAILILQGISEIARLVAQFRTGEKS